MFGILNSRTKEPLNVIFKTHLLKQRSSFTIGNKNGTERGQIQTRWNVKIPQLFMKIIHLKLLKWVSTILDLHFNLPGLN